MSKIRIDQILADNELVESREKAKRTIMAGLVYIDNQRVEKASEKFVQDDILDRIIIKRKECDYVSRAGLKLEKAIDYWNLDFKDKSMLDVGSSTGGFTDCALQNGIKDVCALDVGTNQLAYKLRVNDKVRVLEKTNFRTIEFNVLNSKYDIITMDVSFISIRLLLDSVNLFLKDNGIFICLIKPQFEVGKEVKRNNKGVIIDKAVYVPMMDEIVKELEVKGLYIQDLIKSPIKGGKGNIEFLAKITKEQYSLDAQKIVKVLLS